MEGLAYPLPQMRQTFLPSDDESGDDGDEKGEVQPGPRRDSPGLS